jgi:hypothetical protein
MLSQEHESSKGAEEELEEELTGVNGDGGR